MKTPDADFADILAADTPEIWHSNPPAKGGDTGKLFQRIIATALELRAARHAGQPPRPKSAAEAARRLPALDTPAPRRRAGASRARARAARQAPPAQPRRAPPEERLESR